MNSEAIRKKLVRRGRDKYKAPRYFVEFTGDFVSDELLNDLKSFPHALVIGCLVNSDVRGGLDWSVPRHLQERLGSFRFDDLRELTQAQIVILMTEPDPLHPMATEMSKNVYEAIQWIARKYEGDAARIWSDAPSSAELVYRFLEFRGIGPKIANMGANILARQFRIPLQDYYSIDISLNAHVKRVFRRLGLVPKQASNEQLVFKARSLHSEFPGLLNLPTWEIGNNWCLPKEPSCQECYMKEVCRTGLQQTEPGE